MKTNWHKDSFFGILYGFSRAQMMGQRGKELNYESLKNELNRIKPDYVIYEVKMHHGYAEYPTKIGTPFPDIAQDTLRIYRDVTKDVGIPLSVHFTGYFDIVSALKHPEWVRINKDGTKSKKFNCVNSPYIKKLMIPQMLEIIERYDVDGFWVDGDIAQFEPCYCRICKNLFKEKTGYYHVPTNKNQKNWDSWLSFHRFCIENFVRQYTEAVHEAKPECLVCSNWMYTIRQPDEISVPVDYLSGDYLHSSEARLEAKFLANREISWDLMCWAFQSFMHITEYCHTMKTIPHLCQECAVVIANGGRISIYNNPQVSGYMTTWQQNIIKETADFCRKRLMRNREKPNIQ